MVEAQDQNRDGQSGTSMMDFARQHGYFPATVDGHEPKVDGVTLITTGKDPETNIEIYDDDRTPHRVGETPEWAKPQ